MTLQEQINPAPRNRIIKLATLFGTIEFNKPNSELLLELSSKYIQGIKKRDIAV